MHIFNTTIQMTTGKLLTHKIEVISINDSQPEDPSPLVPHEQQIVDCVIALWKEDPLAESLGASKLHGLIKQKHPNWSVSEKRVKSLLKKFGLLTTGSQEQFTYASQITSESTPNLDLPSKIEIKTTKEAGKGVYAKHNIEKGELIWLEEPLFFVPPLLNVKLMKHGTACSNCGKILQQSEGDTVLLGLDCNACSEVWCCKKCKVNKSVLHGLLKHNAHHPNSKRAKMLDSMAFSQLEDYCLQEQWNSLYAITLIYADILCDNSGIKSQQFHSMARVSQDVRYQALKSSAGVFDSLSGGTAFEQEQQEELWKIGYEKFQMVFPSNPIGYSEFLCMLGSYNINNFDSNLFLIESHLNHNCEPNVSVEADLDRILGLKVFATRDIKAGEELTRTYVNQSHTVQQRQRELRVNWGFICNCSRCDDDLKQQHRRKSSSSSAVSAASVRRMLQEMGNSADETEIELCIPTDISKGERRKSVRFDEKVVAHN